jgi:hypothetical protein
MEFISSHPKEMPVTSGRATYFWSLLASDDLLPKDFCSLPGTAESAIVVRCAVTHQLEVGPNR